MCQAGAFDYILDDVKILVEGILGTSRRASSRAKKKIQITLDSKNESVYNINRNKKGVLAESRLRESWIA